MSTFATFGGVPDTDSDGVHELRRSALRPFGSVVVLRCTAQRRTEAVNRLGRDLRNAATRRRNSNVEIIADGLDQSDDLLSSDDDEDPELNQIDAFVYKAEGPPSWMQTDTVYQDVDHSLVVIARRKELVAVHCDSSMQDYIQRWLDKEPRPAFVRVPEATLQGGLLTGETKGLWLRGTHPRRRTKPDSKNLSGGSLQDALNPIDDASFAMGSARASLPDHEDRKALVGNIGTTPRKALVWTKATTDFREFVQIITEMLRLLEETEAKGRSVEHPFPLLAKSTSDVSAVKGAYDVSCLAPADLDNVSTSDDLQHAAQVLQNAIITVRGDTGSANFDMDVGVDGSIGGSIRARVGVTGNRIKFRFGYLGEPTNPPAAAAALEALRTGGEDLLTVYYRSGHALHGANIWLSEIRTAPFPNWRFADFSGYTVAREKPDGRTSADIHDAISLPSDRSLFAWVVNEFRNGWLTCDDGSGEIADFIHIADDGVLSLIHVKGAHSSSTLRTIAATPYEVVVSQAVKNLTHLDMSSLRSRLDAPAVPSPATWTDGKRVTGRSEFLDMLDCRDASNGHQVVIVQPHVREEALRRARSSAATSADPLRLARLEMLLNSARGAAVGWGADLVVVGSRH